MERIYYTLRTQVNNGTDEEPLWEDGPGSEVSLPYSEANMELARSEAWDEPVVKDDGQSEDDGVSADEVLNALLGV